MTADATLYHGDALDVLRGLATASVDAVVTDPPYGLEFMGQQWDAPWRQAARAASATVVSPDAVGGFQDGAGGNAYSRARVRTDTRRHGGDTRAGNAGYQAWCTDWAVECLRVLKPGGHLLAFGGTRTWHRLACAVEDAGFEMRDSIAWLYGSGFPKSLDVSKAIDKAAGATREVVGRKVTGMMAGQSGSLNAANGWAGGQMDVDVTSPATPAAEQWQGWGTALKPAFEPIVIARKPLAGTVAANVLAHGTGALNIDGCRVGMSDADRQKIDNMGGFGAPGWTRADGTQRDTLDAAGRSGPLPSIDAKAHTAGRWPTNVVLDGHAADELDEQSGTLKSGANPTRRGTDTARHAYGEFRGQEQCAAPRGVDTGGASRFFPTFRYQAKAPTRERVKIDGTAHPTVKPLELMRWLVRLVTPPGGLILDPFAGSGTTVEAALLENFRCVAVEQEATYLPLIVARLERQGLIERDAAS